MKKKLEDLLDPDPGLETLREEVIALLEKNQKTSNLYLYQIL
jgi:hypothetical protein